MMLDFLPEVMLVHKGIAKPNVRPATQATRGKFWFFLQNAKNTE
jgi:hypothetical protein